LSRVPVQNDSAFEFDGEKYRTASKHQKEWGSRIISELKLNGDEHILDMGCGDGVLTVQLAELVPHGLVLGIDASQGMIDSAKTLTKTNLLFKLMDITKISFENEFDLIFSNATLHWIGDHNDLLRKCHLALKEDGMIRFNFAGDGNCSRFIKVVREVIQSEPYAEYFWNFDWPWFMPTVEHYQDLIRRTEFREPKVWEENADRLFATQEEMTKWIEQPSIVPFLRSIVGEKAKREFTENVVTRMIQETREGGNTFFETFRRINVIARKIRAVS
jgi:trans-aconitate 2-methyltransferase